MTTRKKHRDIAIGQIISAIIFIFSVLALITFTYLYDPDKQFSSSFFDDVAKTMQWK